MQNLKLQLAKETAKECNSVKDVQNLLKELFKGTIEKILYAEFEPQIIKKYETTSNEIEEQIIAMYAKGLSTGDIEVHLKDIYGIEVSASLVSKVTDKIFPLITGGNQDHWKGYTQLYSLMPFILRFVKRIGLSSVSSNRHSPLCHTSDTQLYEICSLQRTEDSYGGSKTGSSQLAA